MLILPNKIYDILKFLAMVVLPGLGTLYFALAGIWHLPNGEQVVGSIAAVNVFLGGIAKFSSQPASSSSDPTKTYAGVLSYVNKEDGSELHLKDLDPSVIADEKNGEVTFKIQRDIQQ